MLLVFSAIFTTIGFAIRRNWWEVTDQLSGKHVSHTPLVHDRSWSWHATRVFGGIFIGAGIIAFLSFIYISIRHFIN